MYSGCLNNTAKKVAILIAALMICVGTATAQLEVGDDLKMNLNGSLGFGYTGTYGDSEQSSHNQAFNGNADLSGYYFHPNFLSFNLRPYYQRMQSNTDSQFLSRGSGFGAGASFFGGSRFPGSINYGLDFSSNDQFNFAGLPSVSGDSRSQNFGIAWNALVPGLPTLTTSYTIGSSDSTVLGSSFTSKSTAKTFMLGSNYTIKGFGLQANYSRTASVFETPEFLTPTVQNVGSTGSNFSTSAQHALPLRGSFSIGWNHSSNHSDTTGDWKTNAYSFSNYFSPWSRLSLYQNANYTNNAIAAYTQSILNGAVIPGINYSDGSEGLNYSAGASYNVGHGFVVNGHYTRRWLWYKRADFADSQYGGSLNYHYNTRLLGLFYFGVGVVDTASKSGNDGTGLNANLGMNRKFGRWDTSGDFTYSQDLQTLYTIRATSNYTYGGSVRRRLNSDTQFGSSVRFARSALVANEGDGNSAESFSSFIGWKRYNVSGSYSQSRGTAVLTNTGILTPTPVGSILTNDFLLFDAKSWSVSGSTVLLRRISFSAAYANFMSTLAQSEVSKMNDGDRYSVRADYRLRKFQFSGSFNRSQQSVSTIPGGPKVINSFYLSLSRWFNVF